MKFSLFVRKLYSVQSVKVSADQLGRCLKRDNWASGYGPAIRNGGYLRNPEFLSFDVVSRSHIPELCPIDIILSFMDMCSLSTLTSGDRLLKSPSADRFWLVLEENLKCSRGAYQRKKSYVNQRCRFRINSIRYLYFP